MHGVIPAVKLRTNFFNGKRDSDKHRLDEHWGGFKFIQPHTKANGNIIQNDTDRLRHSQISSLGNSLWRNVSSLEPQEELNRTRRIQYFTKLESALKELTLSRIKSHCLRASFQERCLYGRGQQAISPPSCGVILPDTASPSVLSTQVFPRVPGDLFSLTLFEAKVCVLCQSNR